LIFDNAGNLYGTTGGGGANGDGTVFELTPSNGIWTETVLHSFSGSDGLTPDAGLIFDSAGNLYGTTTGFDTTNDGVVFEVTPPASNLPAPADKSLQRGRVIRGPQKDTH
jgi:uncharacterized repeat protein (TIGR03803 family)